MANWKFILTDLETSTTLTVTDVIGWESLSLNMARSETYTGMFQKATSNLTFIGSGYTFLIALYETYSVIARCSIDCYKFDNNTSGFILVHSGLIDFTTKSENDKYDLNGKAVSFKVLDNDFSTKLFAREKESIPYDRLETLDGAAITPFTKEYQDISLIGMEVLQDVTLLGYDADNSSLDGPDSYCTAPYLGNPAPAKPINNVYGSVLTSDPFTKQNCFIYTENNENADVSGSLTYRISFGGYFATTTQNCEIILRLINFDPITGLYNGTFTDLYHVTETSYFTWLTDIINFDITLTGNQGLMFFTYSWTSLLGVYREHIVHFYEDYATDIPN